MLFDEEVQRRSFTYGPFKHLSVPSVQKIILSWASSTCSVSNVSYCFVSRRAYTRYTSLLANLRRVDLGSAGGTNSQSFRFSLGHSPEFKYYNHVRLRFCERQRVEFEGEWKQGTTQNLQVKNWNYFHHWYFKWLSIFIKYIINQTIINIYLIININHR